MIDPEKEEYGLPLEMLSHPLPQVRPPQTLPIEDRKDQKHSHDSGDSSRLFPAYAGHTATLFPDNSLLIEPFKTIVVFLHADTRISHRGSILQLLQDPHWQEQETKTIQRVIRNLKSLHRKVTRKVQLTPLRIRRQITLNTNEGDLVRSNSPSCKQYCCLFTAPVFLSLTAYGIAYGFTKDKETSFLPAFICFIVTYCISFVRFIYLDSQPHHRFIKLDGEAGKKSNNQSVSQDDMLAIALDETITLLQNTINKHQLEQAKELKYRSP